MDTDISTNLLRTGKKNPAVRCGIVAFAVLAAVVTTIVVVIVVLFNNPITIVFPAADYCKTATNFGIVHGNYVEPATNNQEFSNQAFCEYLGIPYAETPTRFEAPVDWTRKFHSDPFSATQLGSKCLQPHNGAIVGSEDCLFLNVWRPSQHSHDGPLLEVMLFIHGGSFNHGSGGDKYYNGSTLASNMNVIVVTINYRLGPLGFASIPGQPDNVGLRDQQAAMRWVHNQIANFQGDPDSVLIFGESAGAISVQLHAVTPSSNGLFQRVISESGGPAAAPISVAQQPASAMAIGMGCPFTQPGYLACLRSLDASKFAIEPSPFLPVWGGDLIVENPFKSFKEGRMVSSIDIFVAGTNTNEGTMFVKGIATSTPMTQDEFKIFANQTGKGLYGHPFDEPALVQMLELYGCTGTSLACTQEAAALWGDICFVCGSNYVLRESEKTSTTRRQYKYRFNARSKDNLFPPTWGVAHASELPWVFGNDPTFTETERKLSLQMQFLWRSVANGATTLTAQRWFSDQHYTWPLYNGTTDQNVVFEIDALTTQTGLRRKYCSYFESMFAEFAQ